jgi:hypothetical protein
MFAGSYSKQMADSARLIGTRPRRRALSTKAAVLWQVVYSFVVIILSLNNNLPALALKTCYSRRGILSLAGSCWLAPNFLDNANAACLTGDASPDCIGVYKVPIDDNILPYTSTESALKKFAPDTRYVPPVKPPSSPREALQNLHEQRRAGEDVLAAVTAGKLEEAGVLVLKLLPQVTLASRVLLEASLANRHSNEESETVQSLRRQRLENSADQVYVSWNNVDVAIGQGMRGEMGTIIVAQLVILEEVKDAIRSLDDLLAAVGDV